MKNKNQIKTPEENERYEMILKLNAALYILRKDKLTPEQYQILKDFCDKFKPDYINFKN